MPPTAASYGGGSCPRGLALLFCAVFFAPWERRADLPQGSVLLVRAQFDELFAPAPTAQAAEIEVCAKQKKELGKKDPFCGLKWGIFQTSRVPEFWVVHEVEFYWDYDCKSKFPPGLAKSSQTNTATALRMNKIERAWDKDEGSYWVSQCIALDHGCEPWRHYVALQISDAAVPVSLDPLQEFATLRCIRVLQSPHATRMSQTIATVVWANESETGYEVIEHYSDIAAGYWTRRPAYEAGMWRISNGEPTVAPWEVGEILFYSDLFCEKEVRGVPISSDSFGVPQSRNETTYCYNVANGCISIPGCPCDDWLAVNAFNGERLPGYPLPIPYPGVWRAPCKPIGGCGLKQAWIGVDFGDEPRVVNCIRIIQPLHEGYPTYGEPKFASRLSLESWTGFAWAQANFFYGIGVGNWSDTRPTYGTAWRLTNFDRIPQNWEVYELAFYEEPNCGEVQAYEGGPGVSMGGVGGVPISSNKALRFSEQEAQCRLNKGFCEQLGFDLDTYTAWTSECSPCEQRQAWIGILFRARAREIRCFRIFQGMQKEKRTEAIELGYWDGNAWQVERFEAGIGGGTWNHRPAQQSTAFRLLGSAETAEPWTLAGLDFYSDAQCAGETVVAKAIGCGGEPRYPIEQAFDFDPEGLTEWVASCSPPRAAAAGCAPGAAWIGIQGESTTPLVVKCVRLKQHRLRSKQMKSAIVEEFNGIRWARAENLMPFSQLGGGSWQTLPGAQGSMWRLAARMVDGGFGVGFSEVAFFRDAACKGIPVQANFPNVAPISSGFISARELGETTGYTAHYVTMGVMGLADAEKAFDGDYSTFWADLDLLKEDLPSNRWTGWVGMDMSTQVTDVQCIKFAAAPIISLQPSWAELQGWDGMSWISQAAVATRPTLVIALPAPSAGGWQRRPAPKYSMWRIENMEPVEVWEVLELELYDLVDCSRKPLVGWNAIGSARSAEATQPNGGHFLPQKAFDGSLSTRWASWCPAQGCDRGEAWVGLNFENEQRNVRCLRIFQSGRYERQARQLALSAWLGDRWVMQQRFWGLGGNSWHRRPAGPDAMWRVTYIDKQPEVCTALPQPPVYKRSWGLTELEFYLDDECTQKLRGEPIASGSWEDTSRGSNMDASVSLMYAALKATDGDMLTFWSAGCKSTAETRASCMEGEEWIGIDAGPLTGAIPVEVRCVRMQQSRALQRHCCDPAKSLRLDRWNGSAWTIATWRHIKEEAGQGDIVIDASFNELGRCPTVVEKLQGALANGNPGVWELRTRRQSDTCEIPLSGAVKLLADRMCIKHPACADAGFGKTQVNCCPMNQVTSVSRCCCDIPRWKIFEDQWELGIDRKPIEPYPVVGVEYVMIRMITVMPWLGVVLTVVFYTLGTLPRPWDERSCSFRFWRAACAPLQRWIEGNSLFASFTRLLIRREKGEKIYVTFAKRLIIVALGFFIGGAIVWVIGAYIVARIAVLFMRLIAYIVKFSRSRYRPRKAGDRKRLALVLALPVDVDSDELEKPPIAEIMSALIQGALSAVIQLIRAVADIILLRFAFMNLGVVDLEVSVVDIIATVPQLPVNMEWLTRKIYDLLNLAAVVFMEAFVYAFQGVPKCEGPVLTFSGMWLVGITLILVVFLNDDYMGLLAASKNTLLKTRPLFQKGVMVAGVLAFQACAFMFMQVVMLLFSRALSLLFGVSLNPLAPSVGWDCPYADENLAIAIGRIFLLVTGLLALVTTFFAANGHFLGKSRISGGFTKSCGVNVGALDPEPDRMLRRHVSLAMLPTSVGIWIDDWNVKAYMIEERSRVYADGLRFPVECKYCGTMHVPYRDIMKATAMQVSLAWQLIPFIGPLVGKAAEYTNSPPLWYRGKSLACFNAAPRVDRILQERQKKMDGKSRAKYYLMLTLAWLQDHFCVILRRCVALGLYCSMVYFTFTINKRNLEARALSMFTIIMGLSAATGYLEYLFPLVLLLALSIAFGLIMKRAQADAKSKTKSGMYRATADIIEEKDPGRPSLLPVLGQVIQGVLIGSAVAIYFLPKWGEFSRNEVQFVSALCGWAAGIFIILVAMGFEVMGGSRMWANSFFMSYGVGISLFVGWFAGHETPVAIRVAIAVGVGLPVLYSSGVCFRAPKVNELGQKDPSAVVPVLTTYRFVCGPFGIFAGVFVTCMPYNWLQQEFNSYFAIAICLPAAVVVGIVYAFAADVLGQRRPGQCAMIVGTVVSIVVGLLFHWLVAVVLGSVLATIVGAVMEKRMMDQVDRQNLEPSKYTKSKVMSSQALVDHQPQIACDVLAKLSAPTYVRAETPTRTTSQWSDPALAIADEYAGEDGGRSRPPPLALPDEYDGDQSPALPARAGALAAGVGVLPLELPGATGHGHDGGYEADAQDHRRETRQGAGRRQRDKRFGLGATASNLVVPQGAPSYEAGANPWQGPEHEHQNVALSHDPRSAGPTPSSQKLAQALAEVKAARKTAVVHDDFRRASPKPGGREKKKDRGAQQLVSDVAETVAHAAATVAMQ